MKELPEEGRRTPVGVLILMAVVTLWSGALSIAFGYALLDAHERLGVVWSIMFGVLAPALAIVSVRTAYELGRHLLRRLKGG